MKLKDIAQPKQLKEALFNPGYLDKLFSPLFDAHTEIGQNLEQNHKLERYRAEFDKIEMYLDNAQKLMDRLSKY